MNTAPATTSTFTDESPATGKETTYTETVWVSDCLGYSLTRTAAEGGKGYWEVRCNNFDLPSIAAATSPGSVIVTYGVNWSAMGTKTAEEARDYARQIMRAARVADDFTDIRAEYK